MNCIVTGGSGFIGYHLCNLLRSSGHRVCSLDLVEPASAAPGVEYKIWDIRKERDDLYLGADYIFHLAAVTGARGGPESAMDNAQHNVVGTVQVALAALRVGAKIIFISSGAVTPEPRMRGIYGWSKDAGESALHSLSSSGLQYAICRLTNVYGFQHRPKSVIGQFVQCNLRDTAPEIHGTGDQVRDFIHVSDICRGLASAAGSRSHGPHNLSTGKGTTIKDLYSLCAGVFTLSSPIMRPDAASGMSHSVLRPTEHLPWSATVPLEAGLLQTYREQLAIFQRHPVPLQQV